jgi:ketosteroid isomerase-like protein
MAAMEKLDLAFVNGDRAAIESLMAADAVGISEYYGGPVSATKQAETQPDLKYESFERHDVQVFPLSPDAAFATYSVTAKGTFKGEPLASRAFVTEIWQRRDGTWVQRLYQETPLARP